MSPFMSSMLAAPLMEMPPVSKQTPLPTKATGCSPFLAPFQRMITVRLGCVEPWPTPSSAPMPSLVIALTSSTSTSTPSFLSWLARRANSIGYSTFGGSLTSSRAMMTPSTMRWIRARRLFSPQEHRRPQSKCRRARLRSRRPSSWSCSGRSGRPVSGCPTQSMRPASGCIAPSGSSAMKVTASLAALSLPAITPPNLRKSFSFRSDGLPAPTTSNRSALIPSGARISSAAPLLPLNWLVAAARLMVSPPPPAPCGSQHPVSARRRKTPPKRRGARQKMGQSRP